ncbi:MAG TPA: hypothetical protein VIZ22_03025 [Candidatus Limnocylindrales bacterium]
MTGELGIWQHAIGPLPNEAFGYCTDDVARALTVDLDHARVLGWPAVETSAWRSVHFMRDAFDPATGRFRNFRAADGHWLDGDASQDSYGRAMLALGGAMRARTDDDFAARARLLFAVALPGASRLTALRATASTLLGCATALESADVDGALRDSVTEAVGQLSTRLGAAFAPSAHDADWPWPEPVLTYENALLPRALIVAGRKHRDHELIRLGLLTLDWLMDVQTSDKGRFSPIGSSGFWPRGGPRARFDQQPIEATAMILAAEAAFAQTDEPRYLEAVDRAYGWFLGDNDVGLALADPVTGGCFDGLEPAGVNLNQGAESTLMWLTALEHVREIRGAASAQLATRTPARPAVATVSTSRG